MSASTNSRPLPLELPPRGVELLQLLADGHTVESAAQTMSISLGTAKMDMRLIRARLHARNQAHAIAVAWRAGLIR
jgi:two-component system invasion response regulator UvrY